MDMAAVAEQLGDQLDTITGLRVVRWPAEDLHPPAAVVAFPELVEFDATYGRGMDTVTLPVFIVVGRVSERKAAERLLAYWSGSGAFSIKAVIDGGTYTAFDVVRVASAEPTDDFVMAGSTYVAVKFTLEIAGQGA